MHSAELGRRESCQLTPLFKPTPAGVTRCLASKKHFLGTKPGWKCGAAHRARCPACKGGDSFYELRICLP